MKILRTIVFGAMAFAMLFNAKPSQAGIGAIVAAPVVVTAGLIVAGVGGVTALSPFFLPIFREPENELGMIGPFIMGAIIIVAGLVVLDEKQGMSYAELNPADGLKLGLTEAEINTYNKEIDQVNALASYVDSKMAELEKPTTEDSRLVWESVDGAVSADTFKVMKAVTIQLFNK